MLAVSLGWLGPVCAAPLLAFDPGVPGADSPPAGGSLFDAVFALERDGRATVSPPYPFSALLERLEREIAPQPGRESRVRRVLIPFGRSLQRAASAPDHLASPRIVVAVDSPPPDDHPRPMWLKDRLFLGYQPASATIEVISYNPAAGRFEFQVVTDYRAGGSPRTRYARRRLCLSCHQNGAPIFARDPWSESSANPAVEAALARRFSHFHSVAVAGGHREAAAIDNATDRAGLLSVYRQAWHSVCGEAGQRRRCRAGAVAAMLRARMGPFAFFTPDSRLYREAFEPQAAARWHARWPEGLAVPAADIPDRRVLEVPRGAPPPQRLAAAVDPLTQRDASETLAPPGALGRVLIGMAESLPDRDLRRLDRHLQGQAGGASRIVRFAGRCDPISERESVCPLVDGAGRTARLVVVGGADRPGIGRIEMFDGTVFYAVEVERRPALDGLLGLIPRQRGRGLSLRIGDGRRIGSIALEGWSSARRSRAALDLVDDFAPVERALQALASDTGADNPLAASLFDGPAVTSGVLVALGLAPTLWCCPAAGHPRAEPAAADPSGASVFHRVCNGCHVPPGPVPPPFLAADDERTLLACAPLVVERIQMWAIEAPARPLAPMPPWTALAELGIDPAAWIRHPEYHRLREETAALLARVVDGSGRHPPRGLAAEVEPPCRALPLPAPAW